MKIIFFHGNSASMNGQEELWETKAFFSRIEGILKRVLRKQKSSRKKMVE